MTFAATTIQNLLACSICWGADGGGMDAANAAVGFMLVILLGVLGSFLGFIFYLARKSRQAEEIPAGGDTLTSGR